METTLKINLNDYLSEDEKKEYAIEAFKESIKKELFKSQSGTIQSDSEAQRIIANISHEVIVNELEGYIPNFKDMIIEKVRKSLSDKELSYYIFKDKDVYGREQSLGSKYLTDEIKANEEMFKSRIKECIKNYDVSDDIANAISDKFGEMADTVYSLSELFHNKTK